MTRLTIRKPDDWHVKRVMGLPGVSVAWQRVRTDTYITRPRGPIDTVGPPPMISN